jgi:predicted amidohydrolase
LPSEENIADLFSFLWRELDEVLADFITAGWPELVLNELHVLADSIDHAAPGTIPPELVHRLGPSYSKHRNTGAAGNLTEQEARDYLLVAKAIDFWFLGIHPRYVRGSAPIAAAQRFYCRRRGLTGHYNASTNDGWVIPKAPLRPEAVAPEPVANKLDGQFYQLSLARPRLGPRKVDITVWDRAVDPEAIDGPTRVGFIPLAEGPDDLRFEMHQRRSSKYLDVQPADDEALADRAALAIEDACKKGAHICILPELCVSPRIAERIQSTLARHGLDAELRLVIAGSGLHPAAGGASGSHNECLVFDRIGRCVWRQPKINAYAMGPDKMKEYQIFAQAQEAHLELTRPGARLQIRESAGLGRMMVLICEDLVQIDPGRHAREEFPPDWVFSPILDGSIGIGRWVHRTGHQVAAESRSRVVVANSMTLTARTGTARTCTFGLCIDDGQPRRIELVLDDVTPKASPVVAYVDWKPTEWRETSYNVEDPPESGQDLPAQPN